MDLFVRFGATVRRLRMQAGYSQESFADLVNMHRNYIGTVERGETNISLENMYRIARGLRISLTALFAEMEGTAESSDGKSASAPSLPAAGAQSGATLLRPALDRVAEARQALEEAMQQLERFEGGAPERRGRGRKSDTARGPKSDI